MSRLLMLAAAVATISLSSVRGSEPLRGTYVEARTCQVYTGPCFANGEVGSTGKDAIMTWQVKSGEFDGVDLKGHAVAMIVRTSHTLGFNGFDDAKTTKAIVIVDVTADPSQSEALLDFARSQTGITPSQIAKVYRRDIEMQFDMTALTATVEVDDFARLVTRKARPGDCICSNESAYYPPLTKLKGSVPAVTIEGDVTARRLGGRWSIPDTRTAYIGTFDVDTDSLRIASKL
jgi:hypothetical protein